MADRSNEQSTSQHLSVEQRPPTQSVSNLHPDHHDSDTETDIIKEITELRLTASASVEKVLSEIEPRLEAKWKERHKITIEEDKLEQAIEMIKADCKDEIVVNQIDIIFDMYVQSQAKNRQLAEQNRQLLEKVETLEARIEADPRILKILRIADRHRKENALLLKENKFFEADIFYLNNELKRFDDIIKGKQKSIERLQERNKKIAVLEKQNADLEVKYMSVFKELHSHREQHNPAAYDSKCLQEKQKLLLKAATADVRISNLENEWTSKFHKLRHRNHALAGERDAALAMVESQKATISTKETEIGRLRQNCASYVQSLSKAKAHGKQITSKVVRLRIKIGKLKSKISTLEEIVGQANLTMDDCKVKKGNLQATLKNTRKESAYFQMKLLKHEYMTQQLRKDLRLIKNEASQLQSAHYEMSKDFDKVEAIAQEKHRELASLKIKHERLTKLYEKNIVDTKHLYNQAMMLTKLLAGAKEENVKQLRKQRNMSFEKKAIQSLLDQIIADYHEETQKLETLRQDNQTNLRQIMKDDKEREEQQREMTHLVTKNIDLCNMNLSQIEVQTMLSGQLELKTKECDSLQSTVNIQAREINSLKLQDNERLVNIGELKSTIKHQHHDIDALKDTVYSMDKDTKHLHEKLDSTEKKLEKANRENQMIRVQRDVFGTKVLQKKTELSIVCERGKTAEHMIKHANLEFENMKNDIFVLKLEVKNLRRKLRISEAKCAFNHQLQQDLCLADRETIMAKNKLKSIDIEPNRNIHRWRTLQNQDPSRYELIVKIRKLTRRLLLKTTECVEKEVVMKKRDIHFMQLQTLLIRRENPAANSEVSLARATIRKQNRQLKALTAELNMKNDDLHRNKRVVEEQKQKIDQYVKEEAEKKRKNLANKKKTGGEESRERTPPAIRLPPIKIQPSFRPPPPRHLRK